MFLLNLAIKKRHSDTEFYSLSRLTTDEIFWNTGLFPRIIKPKCTKNNPDFKIYLHM